MLLTTRIVTSSGKIRWVGRVKFLKLDRRKRFRSRAEAMRWANAMQRELVLNATDSYEQFTQRTFEDLVERYRREELARLKPSSQLQIDFTLRRWTRYVSPTTRLSELTAERLMSVKGLLVEYKPTYANNMLSRLGRVLAVAVTWGWLPTNPMQRVRRIKEGVRPYRVLTEPERQRLFFFARKSSCAALLPLIIVALSAGPRKTELRKLTWNDYDAENNRLYLRETKNGEPRALPLFGQARQVVAELYRSRTPHSRYIFLGKRGGPVNVDYHWALVRDQAGLVGFRFHDLRHSCASFLAMEGATTQEIAEVLGHKTLAMVKRYAHLTRGHTDNVVEAMNKRRMG